MVRRRRISELVLTHQLRVGDMLQALRNFCHDNLRIFDGFDSDDVRVFDSRAITGVNPYAIDVDDARRRH